MSRIASVFARIEHTALIPYVTAGYPSVEKTLEAVAVLASSGCDIIELGVPFSDPLADGATIQGASHHALTGGVTPDSCFHMVRSLRRDIDTPLVLMTYYNPVQKRGVASFCRECERAGVDGLIVPDLPPEEGGALEDASRQHGLDLIYLLTPASTERRIDIVAERSSGFIYLVSLTGVTGTRDQLAPGLEGFVSRIRTKTEKPLCVGFGVSTVEQAQRIARVADGVIIGSRIVQLLGDAEAIPKLRSFVRDLRSGLSPPGEADNLIRGEEYKRKEKTNGTEDKVHTG